MKKGFRRYGFQLVKQNEKIVILSNLEILQQKFATGIYILSPLLLALRKIPKSVEGKTYNQNSALK